MNWKGCGRKRSWPNLRYYPGICLEGLRKTTKNLSQDSRSPPEYEAGELTTQLQRSVLTIYKVYSLDRVVKETKIQNTIMLKFDPL
jgi:hypothetical protein